VRAGSDAETLDAVAAISGAARSAAEVEGCEIDIVEESYGGEVIFDPALRDSLAATLGAPILPTGAGHDAGVLASVVPTAMLFVRNPTGISHAPEEGATDEDCEAGAAALVTVLKGLL